MDLRTVTKLALKLVGIYFFVTAIAGLVPLISVPYPHWIDAAVVLSIYLVIGLVLIWFPGVVVNTVIRIPPSELEGTATAVKLLQVGCILLGAYFAVAAVYGVTFTYAKGRLFYEVMKPFPNSRGPDLTPDDFGNIVASSVEFLLGLGLLLGSRHIIRLMESFK
jgi:hypothetical protein